MNDETRLEPTLLGALLRFWKTALAVAILVTLAATLAAAATTSREHVAESSMVLADPRDDLLFETGQSIRQDDYVNDQVDILKSAEIARLAAEKALERDSSFPYTTLAMLDRITISRGEGAALVRVQFEAETQEWAVHGANAVTAAYREFLSTQNQDRFDASIDVLDEVLREIDDEIATTRDAIVALDTESSASDVALLDTVSSQVARLPDLQTRLENTTDPDARAELRSEIDDVRKLVDLTSTILSFRDASPELTILNQRLTQLVNRAGNLSERRENLQVDSQLLEGGVRFDTPALVAESSGAGDLRTIVASAFLGLVAGTAAAYALALRNRRFKTSSEAGLVAAAPVIASFPLMPDEAMIGVVRSGRLPGTAAGTFFGPVLETVGRWIKESDEGRGLVVGFASPGHGGGTSSIVGALARASVDAGNRTLVVDGDLEVRDLTRMVAPDALDGPGLIDLIDEGVPAADVVTSVSWGGGSFDLVSRGNRGDVDADFFRSDAALQALVELAEGYDLVLLDMPPVFQSQDAATVAGASDRVMLIVGHGVQVGDLERVRDDFRTAGGVVDGLIYNREPSGRKASTGSLNALRQD